MCNTDVHPQTDIVLPRALAYALLSAAQTSPQREICGLIGARDTQPCVYRLIRNVAVQPDRQFLLDTREQIETLRDWRAAGLSLWGIFHSHPNAPATPSAMDLAQAAYPEAVYLILSTAETGVLALSAFRLQCLNNTQAFAALTIQLQ